MFGVMELLIFIILVLVVSGLGLYVSRLSRAKAGVTAAAPVADEPPAKAE